MAVLVTAIHAFLCGISNVDGRVKPGHDDGESEGHKSTMRTTLASGAGFDQR